MIPRTVREEVQRRAGGTCEYCGLCERDSVAAPFHIEHIIPRKHGGGDDTDNLAPACFRCNLHKGPNLSGIDPLTGAVVALFNPRTHPRAAHFAEREGVVHGLTPIGRATVAVLAMNLPIRVEQRRLIAGTRDRRG